jgi:DNA replication protein DnaC
MRLRKSPTPWPISKADTQRESRGYDELTICLAEHELAERDRRRIARHLEEAHLPPGKTLDNFDFEAVPMISKAQIMALSAGDAWFDKGANLLIFGPPESDS